MAKPKKDDWRRVMESATAAALAAGTHGPIGDWRTVCCACRQWVPGLFHKREDGAHVCVYCAAAEGRADATAELARRAAGGDARAIGFFRDRREHYGATI